MAIQEAQPVTQLGQNVFFGITGVISKIFRELILLL